MYVKQLFSLCIYIFILGLQLCILVCLFLIYMNENDVHEVFHLSYYNNHALEQYPMIIKVVQQARLLCDIYTQIYIYIYHTPTTT